MIKPTYLGDGVYLWQTESHYVINTGHHDPRLADNFIYLEPDVAMLLAKKLMEDIDPDHKPS